uniref:Uncharacterized protein n=1 Tax=Trichuris muris TaxID=70415 RepID=A0A5S6R044_TRIMR
MAVVTVQRRDFLRKAAPPMIKSLHHGQTMELSPELIRRTTAMRRRPTPKMANEGGAIRAIAPRPRQRSSMEMTTATKRPKVQTMPASNSKMLCKRQVGNQPCRGCADDRLGKAATARRHARSLCLPYCSANDKERHPAGSILNVYAAVLSTLPLLLPLLLLLLRRGGWRQTTTDAH